MTDLSHIIPRGMDFTHLRRRTVTGFLRAWREVEGSARLVIGAPLRPSLPKEDMEALRKQMLSCLESHGGEITERAHTAELGRAYLGLNEGGRDRFLRMLAGEFDVDQARLAELAQAYASATTAAEKLRLEIALRQALVSPRSTILKQFTALPDGFKFLVNMRADLLPLIGRDSKLQGLEYDLKSILSAWFDVGLLDLAEITWNSPAALLEKLIEYEAVHRIASWDDLKNRLDADRRVFAFFHPKMPLEPLIFVQVALVSGMSDNIQHLLDEKSPVAEAGKADTAIFYSISNAQKGLAGISFGNFLIKRVVGLLGAEMTQIKTFATLSPVPGFRAWLDPLIAKGETAFFSKAELKTLRLMEGDWSRDKKTSEALRPILMRLCAHYLLEEKKNAPGAARAPLDPVAGFHLFNGARLERLNWLGDTSPKGLKQSAGIMANYYYKLGEIDDNHEDFVAEGKIAAGRQVRAWLK